MGEKHYLIIMGYSDKNGSLLFAKDLLNNTTTEYIEEAGKFTLEFCRELGLSQAFGTTGKGYLDLDDNNFVIKSKLFVRGLMK